MHDFSEYFKTQLADERPWTQKTIRASLQGHSYHLTSRQLMEKSKELKKKIGCKRLRYYVNQPNSIEMKMQLTWDDELTSLQDILKDYIYAGHDGIIPKFTKEHQVE